MVDESYKKIAIGELEKLVLLLNQRDALEIEINKSEEFIRATINMLSDQEREKSMALLNDAMERSRSKDNTLTEAIRTVLAQASGTYLTVAQVRDQLRNSGFDFSDYMSNPLASVSTTLRRMKDDEDDDIEVGAIEGVTAYRWKGIPVRPIRGITDLLTGVGGVVESNKSTHWISRATQKPLTSPFGSPTPTTRKK